MMSFSKAKLKRFNDITGWLNFSFEQKNSWNERNLIKIIGKYSSKD